MQIGVTIMSKIEIDYDKIPATVTPRLDMAIDNLNNAISTLSGAAIPNQYSGRTSLSQTFNKIKNIKTKLAGLENYIENEKRLLKNVEDRNLSNITQIQDVTMKRRVKVIKNS